MSKVVNEIGKEKRHFLHWAAPYFADHPQDHRQRYALHMKRRAMLSLACAALALLLPASSSAAKLPGLLTTLTGDRFVVRPPVIGFTGDGTGYVGGLDGRGRIDGRNDFGHTTWLTWTTQAATGTGALWVDNGIPDEAEGTFSAVPVKVRAFAPRDGHFTRVTLRYTENGESFIDERGLRFSHIPGQKGFYEYFIVRTAREYVAPKEP